MGYPANMARVRYASVNACGLGLKVVEWVSAKEMAVDVDALRSTSREA